MIYGSVCSGIEAASVAWHPLGWTPSFFAKIERLRGDKKCRHPSACERQADGYCGKCHEEMR